MNSNYNLKQFFSIFSIFIFIFFLGISAQFEEDGIYINYAKSIVTDGDYNVLNQVDENFNWLITSKLKHPSQHSVIQTPIIVLLTSFTKMVSLVFPSTIDVYKISAIILNIFSLGLGFYFCRRAFRYLNLKLRALDFVLFIATTSTLYFTFFGLSTIEIFVFPISSCLLLNILRIDNEAKIDTNLFTLGIIAAFLVVSKITYLPLFLMTIYALIKNRNKLKKRDGIFFIVGVLLVTIPNVINEIVQYGKVVFLNSEFSKTICVYSITNLITTLKQGYFGLGGYFYTNLLFLPSIIFLFAFVIKNISKNSELKAISIFLGCRLGFGVFQTAFIAGPIVEDHYVGRLSLTALPMLLLGFCIFREKLKLKKIIVLISALALLLWQQFTLFNFLFYYKTTHYGYALSKVAPTLKDFLSVFIGEYGDRLELFFLNLVYIVFISIVISLLIFWMKLNKSNIEKIYKRVIFGNAIILIMFSILNFNYSDQNTEFYFKNKLQLKDRVIVDTPSMLIFPFVIDILKSQYLNAKTDEVKSMIRARRDRYFNSLEGKYISAPESFKEAIKNKNYNYKYFE